MELDWRYSAETLSGELVDGVLRASDEGIALSILRERRLVPLTLERSPKSWILRFTGARAALSLADLAAASRRLADLLNAGLPLLKALELAGGQFSRPKAQAFFTHLASETRAGRPLSTGLTNGDFTVPPFFTALVRAGESIGALSAQFSVLAEHYERALKQRREVNAQLAYPLALFVLIILTMIFLSFFVLPQFETIFENSSAPPPLETRIALGAGAFIRNYLYLAPVALAACAAGWRWALARLRTRLDVWVLSLPAIGALRRIDDMGRYCRTLSTVLSGGIGLSDAMPLAAATVQSDNLRTALSLTEHDVRAGLPLSEALARRVKPPAEIRSFLEVGDETGALAQMSGQAAHFAEERVHRATKRFMTLLAPALTAIMGLATAGVIAAVMSGVLSLNEAVY